jgi:hypothetical protein
MAISNIVSPKGATTERLFYSTAFVVGFGDASAGRPFRYPIDARGPNPGLRSAQIAYERGRQFAVLWAGRSVTDLGAMKAALQTYHDERIIT